MLTVTQSLKSTHTDQPVNGFHPTNGINPFQSPMGTHKQSEFERRDLEEIFSHEAGNWMIACLIRTEEVRFDPTASLSFDVCE
jgi:hypothetical protein